jgi:stage IV sporulation protein FB
MKDNYIIRLVFGIISIICLLFLCIFTQNFLMLIIPVFIGIELFNENKHQKIRDYLVQEKINYKIDYDHLPDKDYWLIRDCLLFSFPKKYVSIQPGKYEYSFAEPLLIKHISAVLQVNLNYDLNLLKRVLLVFVYAALIVVPIVYFVSKMV